MDPATSIADAKTARYASLNSTPGIKSTVLFQSDSQKIENGLLAVEATGEVFQNIQNNAARPKNQSTKLTA
jgi:hypothetical protein